MLEVGGVIARVRQPACGQQCQLHGAAGSITALIGPNGAGKTTLFNLIGGYQPLDGGNRRHCAGSAIERCCRNDIARLGIGRTFQNLQLFDNMTVLENVMCGRHRLHATGILADLGCALPRVRARGSGDATRARECARIRRPAAAPKTSSPAALSFGHQRLVEIARALALRPKLLLMDEPASGLNDTETERLAELILRIAALGVTVLLVEHDMRLVMGLADHVVVMHHGEKIAEGPPDARARATRSVIAAYLGQEVA